MDDASALASKLQQEGEKFATFLQILDENQRHAAVYSEGALWTVRSVLAHVMSAEGAFLQLFREILEGGVGVHAGFEIDRFNASEQTRLEPLSWVELLAAFQVGRARMVEFVNTLASEDLHRVGRHPFLGVTSLGDMVKMIYVHDQMHLPRHSPGPGIGLGAHRAAHCSYRQALRPALPHVGHAHVQHGSQHCQVPWLSSTGTRAEFLVSSLHCFSKRR